MNFECGRILGEMASKTITNLRISSVLINDKVWVKFIMSYPQIFEYSRGHCWCPTQIHNIRREHPSTSC